MLPHVNGFCRLFPFRVVCYTAVFSVVTQAPPHSTNGWGGALRDDTKNGCLENYIQSG